MPVGRSQSQEAIPVWVVDGTGGPSGSATAPTYVTTANYTPKAPAQQITIATLATAQTLTVPSGSTIARLQNNTSQPLRWRDDGTAPTVAIGQRLPAGETLIYDGSLAALQIIREADGTGTLDVAYYA